jgi:hypothetical protein
MAAQQCRPEGIIPCGVLCPGPDLCRAVEVDGLADDGIFIDSDHLLAIFGSEWTEREHHLCGNAFIFPSIGGFLMEMVYIFSYSPRLPLRRHLMLTGSELLAKVKELGDVGKSEIVRACGYVSTKKDGAERLNFTAFYEALLEAKGVEFGAAAKVGKGGRRLSYVATVQGNGNLLIGKAYTAMMDLMPGDEFEIKLGRKQIRLVPVGSTDDEE